jgi:hypothetical protein
MPAGGRAGRPGKRFRSKPRPHDRSCRLRQVSPAGAGARPDPAAIHSRHAMHRNRIGFERRVRSPPKWHGKKSDVDGCRDTRPRDFHDRRTQPHIDIKTKPIDLWRIPCIPRMNVSYSTLRNTADGSQPDRRVKGRDRSSFRWFNTMNRRVPAPKPALFVLPEAF